MDIKEARQQDIAHIALMIRQKMKVLDDSITTPGVRTLDTLYACYDLHTLTMLAVSVAEQAHFSRKG